MPIGSTRGVRDGDTVGLGIADGVAMLVGVGNGVIVKDGTGYGVWVRAEAGSNSAVGIVGGGLVPTATRKKNDNPRKRSANNHPATATVSLVPLGNIVNYRYLCLKFVIRSRRTQVSSNSKLSIAW